MNETTATAQPTTELPWTKHRAYIAQTKPVTIETKDHGHLTFMVECTCTGEMYYRSRAGVLYKLTEKSWSKVEKIIAEELSINTNMKKVEKSS